MRRVLLIPVLLALLLVVALPMDVQAAQGSELEQFQAAVTEYEKHFTAGDVDALMTLFAEEVKAIPPGEEMLIGRPAIEAHLTSFLGAYTLDRQFEVLEYAVNENTAYRLGEWTNILTPVDGGGIPQVEVGHCMFGYEKVDGEWMVVLQLWNYEDLPNVAPAMTHDGMPA